MKTQFYCTYALEYLPKRYSATQSQIADRSIVYNFKNTGTCHHSFLSLFSDTIKQQAGSNKSDYVICFIPASSHEKSLRRYRSLATYLEEHTGVRACLSAIKRTIDKESDHFNGKCGDPLEGISFDPSNFCGKKVILIDDVLTRGRTFISIANELLDRGAVDVYGLFIAKTINPDWHSNCA